MISLEVRLLNKVKLSDNECWNYDGALANGYGFIYLRPIKNKPGKYIGAHRASWIIFNGTIPDGMMVCHKCDNPLCVNPDHLFLGTAKDNAEDMVNKGRDNPKKGESGSSSKLKERDVLKIIELLSIGMLQKEIAKKYGVSKITISDIKCGRTWKHINRVKGSEIV